MAGTRTRWIPVLGVLVAAPWFAEMAWGGYPATDIPVILLFLGPMYGGAALLVREVARRTGRGWPTMLLLAAAFGAYLLYLPTEDGSGVAVAAAVIALAVATVGTWSRSRRWSGMHTTSLVVGTTLTGLATPFLSAPYEDGVSAASERVADVAAATICLLIVAATVLRLRVLRTAAPTSGP